MIPDYRIKTEAKGIALIEEYNYFNTGKQYSAIETVIQENHTVAS